MNGNFLPGSHDAQDIGVGHSLSGHKQHEALWPVVGTTVARCSGMPSPGQAHTAHSRTLMLAFCGFLVVALFFLATEHRAHALGALPYALILVCLFFTSGCTGGIAAITARRSSDRFGVHPTLGFSA